MYESHFGFTGAPFLLNPDPRFYFDSRGHNSALSYLKFGLYQAEGFIVVTGEIGAGKTTLVRTLLKGIDSDQVVAVQLVSTQLEAGDLLRAVISAFGIPPQGNSKAELIATLEAYLTLLATQQRRAVLIVDEAQNLSRDAIEELRMLSNFQFGNQALLQSFLIGQPELRTMLMSRSLEQLRQRVIASYHLGPMDRHETRSYIEHRLQKVGWVGKPRISDEAFEEFHEWASGIPRRINLLCNRVLLATFLAEAEGIEANDVARIAQEMRTELGEAAFGSPAQGAPRMPTLTQGLDEEVGKQQPRWPAPADGAPAPAARTPSNETFAPSSLEPGQAFMWCVTGSRAACLRAAPLLKALGQRNDLPPVRLLHVDVAGRFELTQDWAEHLGLRAPDLRLQLPGDRSLATLAATLDQLDAIFTQQRPCAVIVQSSEDAALAACLVAQRHGIAVIHIEAGLRSFDRRHSQDLNALVCDHGGDLLLTSEWPAHDNLSREGVPMDRVQFVGNLLTDTVRPVVSQASPPKYTLRQLDLPTDWLKHPAGFGAVYLRALDDTLSPANLRGIVSVLSMVSKDLPLLWVMHDSTRQRLEASGVWPPQAPAQILALPIVPYHKMLGLLTHATCVLSDSATVQEEATILGLPCLTLSNHTERRLTVEQGTNIAVGLNASLISRAIAEILRGGGKKGRLPKFWDGQTAQRIGEHLATWARAQGWETTARGNSNQTPAAPLPDVA